MKYTHPLIILILYSVISLSANAKQLILTGFVHEITYGKPLPNVMVTLRPENSKHIIKFVKTLDDGSYEIIADDISDCCVINFSIVGYATKTVHIVDGITNYDVGLEEHATQLKEVLVKAPSIRQHGDTIKYNVASFADGSDKSIADVLKKMPGIEVTDNGEIKYNGRALNKFYIEGHDMLGGRYALATNNIHYKDVATVEVLENHQPIKALEDMSFSENPAINIKLKESAKSRLVGTVKIGGGVDPDIWQSEASLMRFTKTAQSLNTFKSNNVGDDISQENNMLISDGDIGLGDQKYELKKYIDVIPDKLTDISENRVLRNRTKTLTTNNLWSLSNNTDVSTQLLYTHDNVSSSAQTWTSYFMNDSILEYDENESAKSKQNNLSASVMVTSNSSNAFISNTLSTDLKWNDLSINMTGIRPNVQDARLPYYKVQDKLELLKRTGNSAFTFNSNNIYLSQPQSLDVRQTTGLLSQNIHNSAFYSNSNTSLGFYLKPFTVTMKVGVILLSRVMQSQLIGYQDTLGYANNTSMTYIRVYATPEAEYNANGWHINLSMPVACTSYFFKELIDDQKFNKQMMTLSPNLHIKYQLTSHVDASLFGGITQNTIDDQTFFNGLILSDYRNMYKGMINYDPDIRKSVSIAMSYKNPINSVFGNMLLSRNWNESNILSSRTFLGDYIFNSYIKNNTHTKSWLYQGRISKGLDFIHGMFTLGLNYMNFDGSILQNNLLSRYNSSNWNLNFKVNARPTTWLSLIYEINYGKDRVSFKVVDQSSSSINLMQQLTTHLNIQKQWFINISCEHYSNQVADNKMKQLLLANISTAYSFKSGVELSLQVRNLFNQKKYGYSVYSGLMRMSKEYELRQRNIWASVFFHF